MAKDPKGHGSNKKNTGTQGMRLVKTHANGPHTAKVYNNPEWGEKVVKFFRHGEYQPKADHHTDDISDAHGTAHVALQRYADQDATAELAKGSQKSAAVPTHSGTPRQSLLPSMQGGLAGHKAMGGDEESYKRGKAADAALSRKLTKMGYFS